MTDDEALTLIRDAISAVSPGAGDGVGLETDLVRDEVLDSLDLMSFLFELEQTYGHKLDAITEEYDDYRVAALVALLTAG